MNAVQQFIERVGFSGPGQAAAHRTPGVMAMAHNFVGGDDAAGALSTAGDLIASSLLCTLHMREPPVRDDAGVAVQVATYRGLIAELQQRGLVASAELSVKLEQLGLHLDGGLDAAIANLHDLAVEAAGAGLPMTLDMEWPAEVEDTLRAWREVHDVVPTLGIAVQAYLPRTEADCRMLADRGARVRLCKGGYRNRPGITYGTRHDVDLSYIRCLRALFQGSGYPMVATHDGRLIEIALSLASANGRTTDDYELQMMLGVRSDEQIRLARSAQRVRVYVIFGSDWYSWFVGRLAERPANLVTMARAVAEHAQHGLRHVD